MIGYSSTIGLMFVIIWFVRSLKTDRLYKALRYVKKQTILRFALIRVLKGRLMIEIGLTTIVVAFNLVTVISGHAPIASVTVILYALVTVINIHRLLKLMKEDDDFGKFQRKLKSLGRKFASKVKQLAKNVSPQPLPAPAS